MGDEKEPDIDQILKDYEWGNVVDDDYLEPLDEEDMEFLK